MTLLISRVTENHIYIDINLLNTSNRVKIMLCTDGKFNSECLYNPDKCDLQFNKWNMKFDKSCGAYTKKIELTYKNDDITHRVILPEYESSILVGMLSAIAAFRHD